MLNSGSRPYYWAAFVLDGEPTAVRLLTVRFLERDLEDVILRELQIFLPELGIGFSFVARQKRIQLDGVCIMLRGVEARGVGALTTWTEERNDCSEAADEIVRETK
jgi:hypothetical protein